MKIKLAALSCLIAATALIAWWFLPSPINRAISESEAALISSLSLSKLPVLTPDPSNLYSDNPLAAELGHALFFDRGLSASGTVSCASCHRPELSYTDGLPLAIGNAMGPRHTPSLLGVAHSPWFYWDGRKDSQWAQALAPLEAGHEHNIDRLNVVRLLVNDNSYAARYQAVFGELPSLPESVESASPLGNDSQRAAWNNLSGMQKESINRAFANVGKSLAAYQRKILPGRSKFDVFADSLENELGNSDTAELNASEIAGLKLFVGKAQCITCHNGPLLTNHEFHNTGIFPLQGELPPMGRYDGVRLARTDPFNCTGDYSDASPRQCTELRFARDENDLVGAQKTPTLRNVAETAPYMHAGQMQSLEEVLRHYNEAPTSMLSHNEAKPLGLRPIEMRQLEAFLLTLSAPLNTAAKWLRPPD